jgi:hypothetical protein
VLAGALTLAVALVALPKAASAALEPDNFPPETLGPEYCGFEVPYEVSDNRVILTNVGTGEQVTYVATGTIRVPELEGGELLMVTTGRTVLDNPNIDILVPIGRFTFVIDEEGNFSQPTGNGRLIDACARLA